MKRRFPIQRGAEAGRDPEADEDDSKAEGPEVQARPHGMFLFSLLTRNSTHKH
jgi:hypothetical protein